MGEMIKETGNEAVKRWNEKMPKFFRHVLWLCVLIGGTAGAVNIGLATFGVTPHEWWSNLAPYLIGIPIGMGFLCKFTVDGGFKQKQLDKLTDFDKESNMEE